MFIQNGIEGIEILRAELPQELRDWHKFGTINDLHFKWDLDESSGEFVRCIDMALACNESSFTVQLSLFNVIGNLSFDTANGFYSGLSIEERTDAGCEKTSRFRVFSDEQDCRFELFCERIRAELFSDITSSIG